MPANMYSIDFTNFNNKSNAIRLNIMHMTYYSYEYIIITSKHTPNFCEAFKSQA